VNTATLNSVHFWTGSQWRFISRESSDKQYWWWMTRRNFVHTVVYGD